jgi:tryptophan-rich sensory protein
LKPTLGSGPKNYEWYQQLKKPSITPPQWVFPVVWSILYVMIAASGYLYISKTGFVYSTGLFFYVLGIVLNVIWSPIFFWKKMITLALIDILTLDLSVIITIYFFLQQN